MNQRTFAKFVKLPHYKNIFLNTNKKGIYFFVVSLKAEMQN